LRGGFGGFDPLAQSSQYVICIQEVTLFWGLDTLVNVEASLLNPGQVVRVSIWVLLGTSSARRTKTVSRASSREA